MKKYAGDLWHIRIRTPIILSPVALVISLLLLACWWWLGLEQKACAACFLLQAQTLDRWWAVTGGRRLVMERTSCTLSFYSKPQSAGQWWWERFVTESAVDVLSIQTSCPTHCWLALGRGRSWEQKACWRPFLLQTKSGWAASGLRFVCVCRQRERERER